MRLTFDKTFVGTLAVNLAVFGACDTNDTPNVQVEGCKVEAGQLVITEVLPDPVLGTEGGIEWFEIHNTTDARIELKNLTFEAGSADNPRTEQVLGALDPGIEPGGYVVVGDASLVAWEEQIGTPYYPWLKLDLTNGGATISIKCDGTLIDGFTYGEGGPDAPDKGVALQLSSTIIADGNPYATAPGDGWCSPDVLQMPAFNMDGDRGTPGMPNAACPVDGSCMENGSLRQSVPCQAGQLVINEVYPNPLGENDLEHNWLEFHALQNCDMNGLTIESYNGTDTTANLRVFEIDSAFCIHVETGTYALIAGSTDSTTNGAVEGVVGTMDGTKDGQYGSSKGPFLIRLVSKDGLVVTQATYPKASDGFSVSLAPQYASDAEASMNSGNWCKSTTTGIFEGAGTPGQENDVCEGD